MKPVYEPLTLPTTKLRITLDVQGELLQAGGEYTQRDIPVERLDTLRIELIEPNVSGARDLIKSGEATVEGNKVICELQTSDWLKGGVYRVQGSIIFGTQTEIIYALDIIVPRYIELLDETLVLEGIAYVASTVGDGGGGGGDATVYALDGDGNAKITKPLTVSGSVQEGSPYGVEIFKLDVVALTEEEKAEVEAATGTAYDYYDHNNAIPDGVNVTIYTDEECTQRVGRTVKTQHAEAPMSGDYFNLQEGESLTGGTYFARVESGILGANAHAEGQVTTASGLGSHAEGIGTTASGDYSHAEGYGTIASKENQHVCGQFNVEDTDNTYQFIVGNGSNIVERRNAFAVTKAGELALFEADGTPVILDVATLKALIASLA